MVPALVEACRVVKPGGALVLTIPYPNVIQRLIAWRRRGQGSTLNDEDFYESTYTRDTLCKAVMDAGSTVEKAIPTSHAFTLWGWAGRSGARVLSNQSAGECAGEYI
ncbi:MAG: hypothetical protein H6671_12360 [Anaerolineaceae bacterium]|nr:hypothetical protein [Anaerolineaceae bacterium]